MDTSNLIKQYLDKSDWRVKENSNIGFSLQGLNHYVSSEVTKNYWLNDIYTEVIKEAYIDGDFYIHDLGLLSVYCVGWDLYDILMVGFRGVQSKIESNPPRHLWTATRQIINFFFTLQGEAAGALALSNFDTLLCPFIRYDNLGYKEIRQILQEFIYDLNIPTRVGGQMPFTNLSFDLTIPSYFKDQPVIRGGKPQKEVYGDFQVELDLINKAFLDIMLEGDAVGKVFTFPIPTYNITRDFDWNNPNLKVLWEVTAKFGVPYIANFINSDMKPEDARSMCCRLRVDNRKLEKSGGLFNSLPLTGSVGVVTINLPRIGFLAIDRGGFFSRLDYLLSLAKDSLEIKRSILEDFTNKGLYPYTKFYLRDLKKRFDKYWKNHFSTIGIIGMNEACLNFLGETIASPTGKEFAIEVMDFIREKLLQFQDETGNNYNFEATPAEGASYKLAKNDKKQFLEIICANENERYNDKDVEPFYTNSTQLPVGFTDDVFEVLDLQDEIQTKYTGGTVQHIFVGEQINDYKVVRDLIRKVCQDYHLPYFTITPTFSICPSCGYVGGEHFSCPKCERKCEVFSRVVGYLRPVSQWNKGKQEEFRLRKEFRIKE